MSPLLITDAHRRAFDALLARQGLPAMYFNEGATPVPTVAPSSAIADVAPQNNAQLQRALDAATQLLSEGSPLHPAIAAVASLVQLAALLVIALIPDLPANVSEVLILVGGANVIGINGASAYLHRGSVQAAAHVQGHQLAAAASYAPTALAQQARGDEHQALLDTVTGLEARFASELSTAVDTVLSHVDDRTRPATPAATPAAPAATQIGGTGSPQAAPPAPPAPAPGNPTP